MEGNPKLNGMSEEELKAWKLEMKKMEFDSDKKDMYKKTNGLRGWLF